MAILRIRDENGDVQEILALKGEKGDPGTVAFDELTDEQKASLKGDKGDKGDTGPKGDKGDDNVLHVTVTNNQASHTPSEIKAFVDAGGLAVLEEGYFLTSVDDYAAYFLKSTVDYGNQATMREYTVFEDGSCAEFTQTYTLPDAYHYLSRQEYEGDKTYFETKIGELDKGMVERSNAIKAVKSGETVHIVDGVPFEHPISIKVSDVEDLTSVKVKVKVDGKNLFAYPYNPTKNENGVTFTDNGDGTITVNGTATADSTFYFHGWDKNAIRPTTGKTYTLSGAPSDIQGIWIQTSNGSAYPTDQGKGVTFTASGEYHFYLIVKSGTTVSNVVIKPQLELGDTATEYEAYKVPIEYTPNTDGSVVDVQINSAPMVIWVDAEGAIVTVEYFQDINAKLADIDDRFAAVEQEVFEAVLAALPSAEEVSF